MQKPVIMGMDAAACIAVPATAAAALGAGVAGQVLAVAAYCTLPAVAAEVGVSAVL
jgi:hypothetical protein